MLKGKNAIVTGANRGIGEAVVKALVMRGCNVWACARREDEAFERTLSKLAAEHDVWIEPVYFDLLDDLQVKDALRGIVRQKRAIDILVNVAGLAHMAPFEMTSMDDVRKLYQVNVFAPMLMCQLVMRRMAAKGGGHIVNVASTAAHEVYKGNSVYGASKAALCSFTQSAAAEVVERGVRINAIAPGLTSTEMSAVFEGDQPELPLMRSAIGRKLDPAEIADAIIGLLSDDLRMVNGQVICVNGGAK